MEKKSKQKKGAAKSNTKSDKSKKETFSCKKVIFISVSILIGLAAYTVSTILKPPPLPEFDSNEWWGVEPYDANTKYDESIRPFKIEFSDVMINDLKERLLHRRPFVPPLQGVGFQYGFNTDFLTRVLDYWQNNYDFKSRERFFNQYQHFKTRIQGLDVHFMHVKPKEEGVQTIPILLLHGWPGSVREFYELIERLHSAQAETEHRLEIVAPSLPGFGWSEAPRRPGLATTQIAVIVNNLMHRLGHTRYFVHGGDYGHFIGANLATLYPDVVRGFHTNMPMTMNRLGVFYTMIGTLFPSLIVSPELAPRMYPYTQHLARIVEETGYLHIQATKPDTVGVALTDSPAGLAAYILEKFSTWTNPAFKMAADGELLQKYSLTHLLDNVMVYWSTNSITTSMRLYAENFGARQMALRMDDIPTPVPTCGIQFEHELSYQPDAVLRTKFTNYLRSTVVAGGGHFPALEMPDVLADDIWDGVGKMMHAEMSLRLGDIKSIHDITANDIHGKAVKLDKYKGHVTLIVNVASQCGLTDTNYRELNQLHDKYANSKGLRILAFPCNQFMSQEPGTLKEILSFTKDRGVEFDVFEKVDVNGDNAHVLWQYLKYALPGTLGSGIKWNFSKFIVDKNGVPVERFAPTVTPSALEEHLAKYW